MITTLIPAYRAIYIDRLLRTLVEQTYSDIKIIISDDSHNNIITKEFNSGKYDIFKNKLDITIYPGPGNEIDNTIALLNYWNGNTQLAHILHDDDIIFPDFYRKHLNAHAKLNVGMTSSSRWLSDINGENLSYSPLPIEIESSTNRYLIIKPHYIFNSILNNGRNWLGELSNTVFSKDCLNCLLNIPKLGDPYFGILDLSIYFNNAKSNINFGYLNDHLGMYSVNTSAEYLNPNSDLGKYHRFAWISYSAYAYIDRFLDEKSFFSSFSNFLDLFSTHLSNEKEFQSMCEKINTLDNDPLEISLCIISAWKNYSIAYHNNISICNRTSLIF